MALQPRRRAAFLLAFLLVCIATLAVRLAWVQGPGADRYQHMAREQRLRSLALPAVRGAIYDRSGRELALSVPARTVYANPKQITDAPGTAHVLAPLLGLAVGPLEDRLSDKRKGFVYVARRVDVHTADRISALRLIGVGMLAEPRREYPGGRLASNVTGFVGTDAEGLAGIEHAFDPLLRGRPGERVLEQDPQGRPIPQGVFHERAPVAGADLVLTLDRDIQYAAEAALAKQVHDTGAKGGSVLVMRPQTGEILAMANEPTFDPNDVSKLRPEDTRNRAVTDSYEPGSASKVVTAAAALETGVVTPETTFGVPAVITVAGRQYHDADGHAVKSMAFKDIIAQSSNVGTIEVALRLGPQRLTGYLQRFGYGRSTGLGFPGESSGLLPSASRWTSSLPTMAIGQGLSVTALQIMRVYATVANDGVAVEPELVSGWVDAGGTYHAAPAPRSRRVISGATATTLRQILARVVTDGTGTFAQIPGYGTAGKTGTAQKPAPHGGYDGYMASFMGMVPASEPELAIGVVLDDPTPIWGGVVAAPVFREVGEAALRILRIPPAQAALAPTVGDAARAFGDREVSSTTYAPGPGPSPAPAASRPVSAASPASPTPPAVTRRGARISGH